MPDHSELEDQEERDGAINELHLDVDAFLMKATFYHYEGLTLGSQVVNSENGICF